MYNYNLIFSDYSHRAQYPLQSARCREYLENFHLNVAANCTISAVGLTTVANALGVADKLETSDVHVYWLGFLDELVGVCGPPWRLSDAQTRYVIQSIQPVLEYHT